MVEKGEVFITSKSDPVQDTQDMIFPEYYIEDITGQTSVSGKISQEGRLFYEVRSYHIKNRQLLTTMNKFYLCDPAFGNILVKSGEKRLDFILENVVFLELKRRYPEVYNGQLGASGEIDFVALRNGRPVYFQVAENTDDEKELLEKLTPLQQIRDNYPKYLLI